MRTIKGKAAGSKPAGRRAPAAGLSVLLLSACEMPLALDPAGPAAAQIARDFWLLFWAATAVVVIVSVLLLIAVLRRRESGQGKAAGRAGSDDELPAHPPLPLHQPSTERKGNAMVVWGGAVIPLVLLSFTTVLVLLGMAVFDGDEEDADLNLRITGHMFWWEVEYLDEGFATANEIHIPVGSTVRLQLESADVIHSFWVPQLHGKLELVPGRTNTLYISADTAGAYLGFCAEFCGMQHANMRMIITVHSPNEYEAWLERQRQDHPTAESELEQAGAALFQELACSNCHTVRGVSEAVVEVGPDLTNLHNRSTLAARTIPNTTEYLTAWILNPDEFKPGSNMPGTPLDSGQIDALIAFLGARR